MTSSATRVGRPARLGFAAAVLPVVALLATTLSGCGGKAGDQASTAAASEPTTTSSPAAGLEPQTSATSSSATSPPPTGSLSPTTTRPPSTGPSSPSIAASASSAAPVTPKSTSPAALPPASSVSGQTIVLNPGHNGGNEANPAAINRQVPAGFGEYKACDTTGTNTNTGYTEHAFNWDVSLRVRAILQARGVTVLLTRDSDSGVGPCVDARAAIGNQRGVAAVISIHADGTTDGVGHGFHVCEDSRQPAGPAVAALSHSLTVAVHDSLAKSSGMTTSTYIGSDGYYPRSDLAGLNLATTPSTFLELGNMRNAGDAAEQTSPDGRQRIAASVASGILAYLSRR